MGMKQQRPTEKLAPKKTAQTGAFTDTVAAWPYSLFRFLFGALMVPQVISLLPHLHDLSQSTFVFHYPHLAFIEAYSHGLLDFLAVCAVAGAVLLALGVFSRISALVFTLSFAYLFLIERTFYNNHYYLWCLLGFLFVLSDPKEEISIRDVFRRNFGKRISVQVYLPFALMLAIVYFYGGLVKLNGDWLAGYPMRLMLKSRGVARADTLGLIMSYGGLFFDLFIWIFLFWKPRAFPVVLVYFFFHLANYFTFNIGEFPLVMMAAWLIFWPFGEQRFGEVLKTWRHGWKWSFPNTVLALFFSVQIVYPLASFAMPGKMAWDRQGYYFSWRMMLNSHEMKDFQYRVELPDVGQKYWVDFQKMLTYRQYANAYHDPYHIWLLAQKLKADAEKKYRSKDVRVYCKSVVALNQHPAQKLINDTVNLADVEYHFWSKNHFVNEFIY